MGMPRRRIKTYEVGDSNRYGHYTGNGATYLYNNDLERYDGVQKPTMDWYRLPGATAIYKNRQAVQFNQNSFTGGVTDGAYGVTGMDMSFSNKLSAKKSWFLFDDEVVALGSDINGPGQVETTLENYMLKEGNRTYDVNGEQKQMAMDGQETVYGDIQTLHMQGNTGSNLIFPCFYWDHPHVCGEYTKRIPSYQQFIFIIPLNSFTLYLKYCINLCPFPNQKRGENFNTIHYLTPY